MSEESVWPEQPIYVDTMHLNDEGHERIADKVIIAVLSSQRDRLLEALERLLAENPVFRSKPIGSENSQARYNQKMAIEAENFAIEVIKEARGQA